MLFSQFKRSKDQKYYKNWRKETVFVYILGFIFYGVSRAKTDLHNKYIPLSANPEKWSNTLKQIVGNLPTICLSVFDNFMNLALKGIWFDFGFGSFFEEDHLLNLIILGVYAKRWPKCARISKQNLM